MSGRLNRKPDMGRNRYHAYGIGAGMGLAYYRCDMPIGI
jgi:hypothetical protein